MKSTKKIKQAVHRILGRLSLTKVVLLLIGIVAFFSAVAMTVTSQTGFCNSCHIMNDYYASWQQSSHSEVSCLSCHLQPGFTGYIKGKINGLAQAVDCMVGRVGTKAEATVLDQSCLRSACHSVEQLLEGQDRLDGVKFTHKGHLQTTIDGINVTCGTCHNHISGDEHFSVNKEVCYTCHFTRSPGVVAGLVDNKCLDCHDVPEGVIDRGLVTINHQDFVSYDASCEDSCHKRQIENVSHVSDDSCLHCHTFGINPEDTSANLHAAHTSLYEKVECFACHGQVLHGPDKTSAVATMINCQDCHSNTHAAQKTIFTAEQAIPHTQDKEKVLSPMFLTHVECTGCHVESTASETAALDSLGTVARATPQACDNCHEPGTGQRYVPFWQKNIKTLYEQVLRKADSVERSVAILNRQDAEQLTRKITEARTLLEAVRADGSWGVHNLKYTEAMLLEAKALLDTVESGK